MGCPAANLWAGPTDILHAPPLYDELLRLGYPPHFSTLLGVWKVLGAVALLVPGYPRVKEWADAGSSSISSAPWLPTRQWVTVSFVHSHLVSMSALIASWYLRPQSRRLAETVASLSRYHTNDRLASIDALLGLVVIIMALDHVRDFFHRGAMFSSPTDLAVTTPFLFFTRWLTHICAPVFMLTAGLGVYLYWAKGGRTRGRNSRGFSSHAVSGSSSSS